MRFFRLVGAEISDQQGYQEYRDRMVVLLQAIGGKFEYDFHTVSSQMSGNGQNYNRIFVLSFPSEEVMKSYFSNEEYVSIKRKYFDNAVADIASIASWNG